MNRHQRRQAKAAPDDLLAQGFARHQAGDFQKAEALYRQSLAGAPDHPEAMRLLGEVLVDRGRFSEAIGLLAPLARRYPEQFSAHYSLGSAYRLAGRVDEAIGSFQAALTCKPGFAGAHHGIGAALRQAGRHEAAAAQFAAAAKAEPNWALAWHDLGMALAAVGRLDEAMGALERALAVDPGLAETRRHLLAIRGSATAAEVAVLQAALAGDAPVAAKIESGFALGKVWDKAGTYDAAFEQFAAANARLRAVQAQAGHKFDRARLKRDVDRLIAAFPVGFQALPGGVESETPVFIVGMPRSGTTLVEQIAAAHGQVFGAGEMLAIGKIAGRIGWAPSGRWQENTVRDIARTHLAALAKQGGMAVRVIDKMPDNIFQLGLIATLFPQARIVFCERDPLDTCFSCFTQRFTAPHGFDTDLADCGFRYREVERLTQHWKTALPLRMLTVSYENLVSNQEAESRRLIAFLGLDWDPACLEFHRRPGTVTTASWAQVRQPLYGHAVGRAGYYERHLGALRAALG